MEEGENLARTIPTPNLESRPRPRAGRFGCVVCGVKRQRAETAAGPRPRATDQ
jgi:hypothetical protein